MRTAAATLAFWALLLLSFCIAEPGLHKDHRAIDIARAAPTETLHKTFAPNATIHVVDLITIYSTTYITLPPNGTYKSSASARPSSFAPVPASFTSKASTPYQSSSRLISTRPSSSAIVSSTGLPNNSTASPTAAPLANAATTKGPASIGYVAAAVIIAILVAQIYFML